MPKLEGVLLVLSLVWEGESVKPLNIAALKELRKEFPQLTLVQFLNPAYLTKPNVDKERVKDLINSVVRQEDVLGLHLHGWKSQVEASGVTFRDTPTFWGQQLGDVECQYDCGHEVPLSAYKEDEVDQLVKEGMQSIKELRGTKPQAFMAGGWLGAPHVLEAVAKNGLKYDFSPVNPDAVKERFKFYPMYSWFSRLWKHIGPYSQPLPYHTTHGLLTQVPQNGGMVDYRNADSLVQWFSEAVDTWQKNPKTPVVLHFGFYEETAYQYSQRLRGALHRMLDLAQERKVPVSFVKSLADDIPAK